MVGITRSKIFLWVQNMKPTRPSEPSIDKNQHQHRGFTSSTSHGDPHLWAVLGALGDRWQVVWFILFVIVPMTSLSHGSQKYLPEISHSTFLKLPCFVYSIFVSGRAKDGSRDIGRTCQFWTQSSCLQSAQNRCCCLKSKGLHARNPHLAHRHLLKYVHHIFSMYWNDARTEASFTHSSPICS